MKDLVQFVIDHAERGTCRCGLCCDHPGKDKQPEGHTVDMVFFEVSAKADPDAAELHRLIEDNTKGEFGDLNPFDGSEHSYIEVGGWIGDQGLALMLMGLGALLNLWPIMTPKMLPDLPDDLVQLMAGRGIITIMPKKQPAPVA